MVVLLVALLIANNIYSDRQVNTQEGDDTVDLLPVWITVSISVGLLIGSLIAYAMAPTDRKAPPYMGQQSDADPGEAGKTSDKSGDIRRVSGGKW